MRDLARRSLPHRGQYSVAADTGQMRLIRVTLRTSARPPEHGEYKACEYIRGLAQLEPQERDRCANFATKAVAAGPAERTVRIAERQGQLIVLQAALREVDLSPEQASAFKAALAAKRRS